jgi:hypothetical protein
MKLSLAFLLLALLIIAGCKTTGTKETPAWGDPYTDVVVPGNYEAHDNPPFKRQDGADGKRIYGRYSYRSTGTATDSPTGVLDFLKANMVQDGWALQTEEVNEEAGTMKVQFKKDDDVVQLTLTPDKRVQSDERFSVLIVEMNPKY